MLINKHEKEELEKENLSNILCISNFYCFVNKHNNRNYNSFVMSVLEELFQNIEKEIPMTGNYELFATNSYITFHDFKTNTNISFYDFEEIEQLYISKKLSPVMEKEIEKIRGKYL